MIFKDYRTVLLLLLWGAAPLIGASPAQESPPAPHEAASPASETEDRRLVELGPGDQISLEVYGEPDMSSKLYVGNDGTISVPLAGPVQVAGLTPVVAAKRVEEALVAGQFLKAPSVTISLLVGSSQRVSVLGAVNKPGRYLIDPHTTVFDLLAEAGGTTSDSTDRVYLLRAGPDGKIDRQAIELKTLDPRAGPELRLRNGDEILVPAAELFYIYGEVTRPDKYRLEPGMTVVEAIARAGGVTPRGSDRRVEIKRMGPNGQYVVMRAKSSDLIEPNDVIRVKQSIF